MCSINKHTHNLSRDLHYRILGETDLHCLLATLASLTCCISVALLLFSCTELQFPWDPDGGAVLCESTFSSSCSRSSCNGELQ